MHIYKKKNYKQKMRIVLTGPNQETLKDFVLPSMYVYTILHVYYPLDNHSPSSNNNNNNAFLGKQ